MNVFDNLQDSLQNVVANTMGYDASWIPNGGGPTLKGLVLYKGPTVREKLFDQNYQPDKIEMEYKLGLFEGMDSVIKSNPTRLETITLYQKDELTIFGIFVMKSIAKKWDGKTFVVQLEVKQ